MYCTTLISIWPDSYRVQYALHKNSDCPGLPDLCWLLFVLFLVPNENIETRLSNFKKMAFSFLSIEAYFSLVLMEYYFGVASGNAYCYARTFIIKLRFNVLVIRSTGKVFCRWRLLHNEKHLQLLFTPDSSRTNLVGTSDQPRSGPAFPMLIRDFYYPALEYRVFPLCWTEYCRHYHLICLRGIVRLF